MSSNYRSDDFIINLLRSLSVWLHADYCRGSARRLERFEQTVQQQADNVMRVFGVTKSSIPLFLEAVSILDKTEIWLEAIRLTAMDFDVAVDLSATGQSAVKTALYQHHVMWCREQSASSFPLFFVPVNILFR